MSDAITPFILAIENTALEDLSRRLAATRWPEPETVSDWSQGVPLADLRSLVEYWSNGYDWRRCETELNGIGQFRTTIDGLGIHFLHVRSPHADARPLILTHGWPSSVLEFRKVIGPLTNPTAHGGQAEDAFHVVIPSLPGYGFSDRPTAPGWDIARVAGAWTLLMRRLGYDRFVAQGGDWGAAVTAALGRLRPDGLLGIHITMPIVFPPPDQRGDVTPREQSGLDRQKAYLDTGSGYARQQSTKPQTIGYALADSPVGQAAWIFEKFWEWTDCAGDPLSVLTRDEILDTIMLYWLPNTAASSARFYWENGFANSPQDPISIPTAITVFPQDIFRPSRRWAERIFTNIIYWNEPMQGGHFAASEVPGLFVAELRNAFRNE
ncbi:MAG: epoxide hydrolase family protein [Janthinobacterium lividum]